MLKLQRAVQQISQWVAIEAISGSLDGSGNMTRLNGLDAVIADQVDKYTTGEWEITVEDFVDYDNKALSDSGFARHKETNKEGYVSYLVPLILYPVLPKELVVFHGDDKDLAHPKTMGELIKNFNITGVGYGIVVADDGTDV